MAIKITNLEKIAEFTNKPYIFQDLHLDFKKKGEYSPLLQKKIDGNDLYVDYDEDCIKNSLLNLFNTRPGQRFLFPRYGLPLYQFLFEAITSENAEVIGETIVRAINQFEPRVVVKQCKVIPKEDDNEYNIFLFLHVPMYSTTVSLNTNLDVKTQEFTFLEKSTYIYGE